MSSPGSTSTPTTYKNWDTSKMSAAVQEVINRSKSTRQAARDHGVPYETLRRRVSVLQRAVGVADTVKRKDAAGASADGSAPGLQIAASRHVLPPTPPTGATAPLTPAAGRKRKGKAPAAAPTFCTTVTRNYLSTEPRLHNKCCVVTGAARGVGQAVAVRFACEGARVALLDIDTGACGTTMSAIRDIAGVGASGLQWTALALQCDVSSEASLADAIVRVRVWGGEAVHVLVHCATVVVSHSIETATSMDWDTSLIVNVRGTALATKDFLPMLKLAGAAGASVVMLGGVGAFMAQPRCVTYAATKAAVVQMSRNCALDLAKYNIRVNSVCPGIIETSFSVVERAVQSLTFHQWQELRTRGTILRRVGNVNEVANACLFFAGAESSYCTGSTLTVDGGMSACTDGAAD